MDETQIQKNSNSKRLISVTKKKKKKTCLGIDFIAV